MHNSPFNKHNFQWSEKDVLTTNLLHTIQISSLLLTYHTALRMKFSIKDFFSKCDQIRSFLRIWSHLLKKPLMKNFIFLCSVSHLWPIPLVSPMVQWVRWLPYMGEVYSSNLFVPVITQLAFTCSNSTIETPEQYVRFVEI